MAAETSMKVAQRLYANLPPASNDPRGDMVAYGNRCVTDERVRCHLIVEKAIDAAQRYPDLPIDRIFSIVSTAVEKGNNVLDIDFGYGPVATGVSMDRTNVIPEPPTLKADVVERGNTRRFHRALRYLRLVQHMLPSGSDHAKLSTEIDLMTHDLLEF